MTEQGSPEAAAGKDAAAKREVEDILAGAQSNSRTPPTRVESSAELGAMYDPIEVQKSQNMTSDSGVSIVHSFINRTVFFDYFRHVANKRFPDILESERVQALVDEEPRFYRRSIKSDYVLKWVTASVTIIVAGLVVAKTIFW